MTVLYFRRCHVYQCSLALSALKFLFLWLYSTVQSEMRHHQSIKMPNRPTTAIGSGGGGGGVATDTSSVSPNTSEENFVTVRIRPSAEGQYGFNVYGGVDQKKPVIVSRVGDNLPAGTASPRLNRGDQIIRINGRDISDYTQDQVSSHFKKDMSCVHLVPFAPF